VMASVPEGTRPHVADAIRLRRLGMHVVCDLPIIIIMLPIKP
jgi:hypothetical protein